MKKIAFIVLFAVIAGIGCNKNSDSSGSPSSGDGSGAGGAAGAGGTGTTLSLIASNDPIYTGTQTTISASGGNGAYTYSVMAPGTGTIDATTGIFTAPTSPETDTIEATDSAGNTGTITIDILQGNVVVTNGLEIRPLNATVLMGGSVTFTATGGTPPYSFDISGSGDGSFNGNVFTAGSTAETIQIDVTDQDGTVSTAYVNVVSNAVLSQSATLLTGKKLGVTFDKGDSSQGTGPSLVFFGTGKVTKQCADKGSGDLQAPCVASISLDNLEGDTLNTIVYTGRVHIEGRNHSSDFDFCIEPSHTDRMLIRRTSGRGHFQTLRLNSKGRRVVGGRKMKADIVTKVDVPNKGGDVTVSVDSAGYVQQNSCGGPFNKKSFIRVF